MRYHQIVENTESDYSNYSEAFDRYKKGYCIYKGMQNFTKPVEILKPLQRKSKNTTNYMTTLMSNLPEWSAYPKRNYCTVCSSNYKYAEEYGEIYHIFPENGSKIGICRTEDIFESFLIPVPILNLFLNKVASNDSDYESMIHDLKVVFIPSELNKWKDTIKYFLERKINSFDSFIKIISPNFNKFKLVNITNYSVTRANNREVWTNGNCLAIKKTYIKEFEEKYIL